MNAPARSSLLLGLLAGCALCAIGCGKTTTTSTTTVQKTDVVKDNRTPFTESLILTHKLTDDDLKNVQFYVAGTLNLTRNVKKEDKREIKGGKLIKTAGETIHELLIEKYTPCVCQKSSGTGSSRVLYIAFDKESVLRFTQSSDKYQLATSSPLYGSGAHKVKFEGMPDEYDLPASDYSNAYLIVDLEAINDVVTNRKKLQGVKVGDK